MKNRRFLKAFFALALAILFVGVGCNKPDPDPVKQLDPTITLEASSGYISGNTSVNPGDSVKFKVIVTKGNDGAKLSTFEFTKSDQRTGNVDKITKDIKNETSYTWDTSIFIGTSTGSVDFEFKVTDKDGRMASRKLTVTIQQQQGPTAPKKYTGIALDNTNRFCSSTNGYKYDDAGASANASIIDIAYFYSSVSEHNIVSPLALNSNIYGSFAITWGQVSTEFRTNANVAADSVRNLADESVLMQMFNDGTPVQANCGSANCSAGTRVNNSIDTNIASNKVIFFKGANGKYGAIIINSANNGSAGLGMDVYVQN